MPLTEAQLEAQRRYREKHKDKIRAAAREKMKWRREHDSEKIRKLKKESRERTLKGENKTYQSLDLQLARPSSLPELSEYCSQCGQANTEDSVNSRELGTVCWRCYKNHYTDHEKVATYKAEWFQKNKSRLRGKRSEYEKTREFQYSSLKTSSRRTGRVLEISFEEFLVLRDMPCHYCHSKLPETGYCLDCKDPNVGYLKTNVLPACWDCNRLKRALITEYETIAVVKALANFKADGKVPNKISLPLSSISTKSRPRDGFTVLKRQAFLRDITVSLTKSEYDLLTSMPCTYCGGNLPPTGSGLDRLDHSVKEYSFENSLPSCEFCNEFRSDILSIEETAVAVNAIQQCRLLGQAGIQNLPIEYTKARPERYDDLCMKAFDRHSSLALERGMKLLTTWEEYRDKGFRHKKLKIQCLEGHLFERTLERHLKLDACPDCSGRANIGGAFIEKLKSLGWVYKFGIYTNKNSKIGAECSTCGLDRQVLYRTFTSEPKCHNCHNTTMRP